MKNGMGKEIREEVKGRIKEQEERLEEELGE